MNKITKKLFLYFTILAVFLSGVVFVGFYSTFRYYSYHHHKSELQTRAQTIQDGLELYISSCTDNQELSAYINVLDDISLADAYFVSREGTSFTCSCSCGTTVTIEKKPTKKVEDFAEEIFRTGKYVEKEFREKQVTTIYAGIPVKEEGITNAVVVIVDTFDIDQKSFFYAILILFMCLLVALAVSIILASVLAKRFMMPIQKIASVTKELANGNYKVKTNVNDHTEIGILAKETDILAERLASVEQMQKDYITNISHELRTPVTVIRSSVEALHDGMVPADKQEEYHKQMLSETITLQRLVNDMLELSRLENDEFIIYKEEIDLGQVLEDAIRGIRMISREKEITVHYNPSLEEYLVWGDYGRIRQMFITVLDNAVKYSDAGKNIWIEVHRKSDNYYVSVRDEGNGISSEKQRHIFDKFYRSMNEHSTGLGLVVMKNIARRHEIDVRIHSEEGKGSKFTFIIPIYKCEDNTNK